MAGQIPMPSEETLLADPGYKLVVPELSHDHADQLSSDGAYISKVESGYYIFMTKRAISNTLKGVEDPNEQDALRAMKLIEE